MIIASLPLYTMLMLCKRQEQKKTVLHIAYMYLIIFLREMPLMRCAELTKRGCAKIDRSLASYKCYLVELLLSLFSRCGISSTTVSLTATCRSKKHEILASLPRLNE